MRTGRPKAALPISEDEGAQLMARSRSRSLPAAPVQPAQIVLACARAEQEGCGGGPRRRRAHSRQMGRRFVAERVAGLHDKPHPGRPRTIEDAAVAALVSKTLAIKPEAGTHWSVRTIQHLVRLSSPETPNLNRSHGSACFSTAPKGHHCREVHPLRFSSTACSYMAISCS